MLFEYEVKLLTVRYVISERDSGLFDSESVYKPEASRTLYSITATPKWRKFENLRNAVPFLLGHNYLTYTTCRFDPLQYLLIRNNNILGLT